MIRAHVVRGRSIRNVMVDDTLRLFRHAEDVWWMLLSIETLFEVQSTKYESTMEFLTKHETRPNYR